MNIPENSSKNSTARAAIRCFRAVNRKGISSTSKSAVIPLTVRKPEREACLQAIAQTNYVTVHVYPGACESIGHLIGDAVKLRMEQGNTEPLDILTCVNFQDPANIFRGYALERMETEAQRQFLEEHVGFVETLIFRNGGIPTPEMLAVDPICVSASDNTHWPVDKEAFKGCPPEGIEMDLQDNFAARLCYKVWAGNMVALRAGLLRQIIWIYLSLRILAEPVYL